MGARDWQDAGLPPADRVRALMASMTLTEKLAQLVGVWVGASPAGDGVAPFQHEMGDGIDLDRLLEHGLGQLTRPFGTAPVDPAVGALSLQRTQERVVAAGRHGIPAMAHEESLAGFAAWTATAYPVPLSWGATFDPDVVGEMSARIGADLAALGVHQALAPVLDVVRDARWGRVEETIGEDPVLVGAIGAAYVAGLERAGIVATLKHFAGYSASKGGRNFGPVSVGPRERADVLLPPFEAALRGVDGQHGARSVMHAYTDIDGVPSAADTALLTGLLRDRWGFAGTVVADYFGVAFLHRLHGLAGDLGAAGALALTAGVDVELPTVEAYAQPVADEVAAGRLDESVVDRALTRVLRQKLELGLLDADWSPRPPALAGRGDDADGVRGAIDLDPPESRALAARIAERAVVLLANDGVLPLAAPARVAVLGPNADRWSALLGCYSFPAHVGSQHPDVPLGLALPTVVEALTAEWPDAHLTTLEGTGVDDDATEGIEAAATAAREAGLAVVVLGDRAGLFGRGTSGEGCDAESLALPGAQQALLDAVLDTGVPTVVVLMTGRPYALAAPKRAAAIVQAFFPGEEGSAAVAGVLSGRVNPSGRLPVSVPASPSTQPTTYLAPKLGMRSDVSSVDPTPAFPFGHGLAYTSFEWSDVDGGGAVPLDGGALTASITVRNAGDRAGTEVVQCYLHDPVASVVRPVTRLVAFTRVDLAPGASARVRIEVPTDLASFTGLAGRRVLEPGRIVLRLAASSADVRAEAEFDLTGATIEYDDARDAARALAGTARVERTEQVAQA